MIVYALLDCDEHQFTETVITSAHTDIDKKLADISIQVDQLMYLNNCHVSVVYVARNNGTNFNICNNCEKNTVYFTSDDADSSFYCRPDVLAQISCLYKINYNHKFNSRDLAQFFNQKDSRSLTNKMMYVIDRLGIKIHVG
jgi:hypothetical protein